MNHKVASKTEQYDMAMGGERINYSAVYTMRNGDVVPSEQWATYIEKAA
jgi:sulfur carrier protein ThiS